MPGEVVSILLRAISDKRLHLATKRVFSLWNGTGFFSALGLAMFYRNDE
jgi:hypothetical protein